MFLFKGFRDVRLLVVLRLNMFFFLCLLSEILILEEIDFFFLRVFWVIVVFFKIWKL